jgi:hypothetical protein
MTTLPDLEPAARETLHDELKRLIGEYEDDDSGEATKAEAWNLIADFVVENSKAVLSALAARSTVPEAGKAVDEISKRLKWISEARWSEDADLDSICTYADQALLYVGALASAPAPSGAEETRVTESCGCVFRDLNVPCRDPLCKICHDLPQAVPAEDVAGLVERLNEKHAAWQKLCDRWIAKGKADGMDIEDDFTALRKTTEGEAADALARIAEERNAYIKACDDYERDLKRSEAEATSLRSIIGECAKALGNGAYIAPTCTVEFMGNLPEEIRLLVADLRRKLEERERIGKMMANAIYNVHQRGLLVNADDMDSLKECQEAWDRTLSGASE